MSPSCLEAALYPVLQKVLSIESDSVTKASKVATECLRRLFPEPALFFGAKPGALAVATGLGN